MNRRIIAGVGIFLAVGAVFVLMITRGGLFSDKTRDIFQQAEEAAEKNDLDSAISLYNTLIKDYPSSKWVAESWLGLESAYEQAGQLQDAKDAYKKLLTSGISGNLSEKVNKDLQALNMKLLFSPVKSDNSFVYKVEAGDTLIGIAKRFKTTVALIQRANNLKGSLIRPNMELKISRGGFSVEVDKSKNILTLKANDEVLRAYDVSTGKSNSTPVGVFTVTDKLINPVWYTAGAIVSPDSPENILGTRWIGISKEGYGIHGTTEPETIGRQITRGCVRMNNSDVEELFDILPVGTEVVITD